MSNGFLNNDWSFGGCSPGLEDGILNIASTCSDLGACFGAMIYKIFFTWLPASFSSGLDDRAGGGSWYTHSFRSALEREKRIGT